MTTYPLSHVLNEEPGRRLRTGACKPPLGGNVPRVRSMKLVLLATLLMIPFLNGACTRSTFGSPCGSCPTGMACVGGTCGYSDANWNDAISKIMTYAKTNPEARKLLYHRPSGGGFQVFRGGEKATPQQQKNLEAEDCLKPISSFQDSWIPDSTSGESTRDCDGKRKCDYGTACVDGRCIKWSGEGGGCSPAEYGSYYLGRNDGCAPGLFCDGSFKPPACRKLIQYLGKAVGQASCDIGLVEINGVCSAPSLRGAACRGRGECAWPLACFFMSGSSTCVEPGQSGEPCAAATAYMSEFVPGLAYWGDYRSCAPGLECAGGTCRNPGGRQ